jgi:hypothetical protein
LKATGRYFRLYSWELGQNTMGMIDLQKFDVLFKLSAKNGGLRAAAGLYGFGLSNKLDSPQERFQSARTKRMIEKADITHNAKFPQTQKKAPLEFTATFPPTSPADKCSMGIPVPNIASTSMMMYPDRRPANASVPYNHPAISSVGMTILRPPRSIP